MPTAQNKIQRVLLDVNVCIDIIANRSLSPENKKILFAAFIQNEIEVFVPAFSIDTVYYVLLSVSDWASGSTTNGKFYSSQAIIPCSRL